MAQNNQEEKNLDNAQNRQNKVGEAASNPETSDPSENLREKAAEMENKNEEAREPV